MPPSDSLPCFCASTSTHLALASPSFPEPTLKTTLKVLSPAPSLQPSDEWDTRIQTPSEKAGYQAREVRGIRSILILPKSEWELGTDTEGPSTGLKELLCVTIPYPLIAPEQSFLHHKFCACGYNRRSEQGGQTPQAILRQRWAACISSLLSTVKKEKVWVTQLCLILCDPMDYNPPDSSVHGILQARLLEWVAIPFSRVSSQPRDWTQVSRFAGRFFTHWATRETPKRWRWILEAGKGKLMDSFSRASKKTLLCLDFYFSQVNQISDLWNSEL